MLVQEYRAAASSRPENFHALVKEIDAERQAADRRPARDHIARPLHKRAACNGRSERQSHKEDDEHDVHVGDSFDVVATLHRTKNERCQIAASSTTSI